MTTYIHGDPRKECVATTVRPSARSLILSPRVRLHFAEYSRAFALERVARGRNRLKSPSPIPAAACS